MARQAEADGIGIVCATPHIRHDHDVRIAELPARVDELNVELEADDLRVRVVAAGEVAETALDGLTDDELAAVALGGTWVLLEPAPGPLDGTLAAVERLRARGFRALVAHPERHPSEDLPQRLAGLVDAGALIQGTAAPIAEGERWMTDLVAAGLVHVLGTDSHSSLAGRPVRLAAAFAGLRRVPAIEPQVAWMAHEAPSAILRGDPLEPPFV